MSIGFGVDSSSCFLFRVQQTDGWMEGRMDGRTDGWTDGRTDTYIHKITDATDHPTYAGVINKVKLVYLLTFKVGAELACAGHWYSRLISRGLVMEENAFR